MEIPLKWQILLCHLLVRARTVFTYIPAMETHHQLNYYLWWELDFTSHVCGWQNNTIAAFGTSWRARPPTDWLFNAIVYIYICVRVICAHTWQLFTCRIAVSIASQKVYYYQLRYDGGFHQWFRNYILYAPMALASIYYTRFVLVCSWPSASTTIMQRLKWQSQSTLINTLVAVQIVVAFRTTKLCGEWPAKLWWR